MRFLRLLILTTFVLSVCRAEPLFAGGPFIVDMVNSTGVAQRWQNDTLTWCAESGKLSSQVSNVEAKAWIREALDDWANVTIPDADNEFIDTATIKVQEGSNCEDVDIDISNCNAQGCPWIVDDTGDTTVIFDDTGDIISLLVSEDNRDVVVGLSQPLVSDSSGKYILKGFAIFNGRLLDNNVLAESQEDRNELFQATVLHELGHLLNLDHSQVNFDIAKACVRNGTCEDGQFIPTMYPELLTKAQGRLSRDDKVTISSIYPSDAFEQKFCTLTGEIFDSKGRPLKGVNVIASKVQEPERDARSFVSGVLWAGCKGTGRYNLHGIVPGRAYAVTYEPIGSQFTGASDFEPLDNPPRGFDEGIIETPSGATTVMCEEPGETIEMASVTIDTPNPCEGLVESEGDAGQDLVTGEASGSCSFLPQGRAPWYLFGFMLIGVCGAVFIAMRIFRKRVHVNASSRKTI